MGGCNINYSLYKTNINEFEDHEFTCLMGVGKNGTILYYIKFINTIFEMCIKYV